MADKRISQLVDRGTVLNNDVVPIVAFGASTTNKATISSIQTFMQGNLDLGVTSVGITIGSTGTDVNVTGSPVTSSGNITINIPTASATNRGLLSAADWSTFNSKQGAITLTTTGTSGVSTLVGSTLNIPNYTTDLSGYVTLGTAQTITAQKTFTTSGSSDTMIISHGSGSGFALDVLKAGNGEAIRVTKTSGSGNAMTISGGNFEAGTIVKTGGTSSQYLMADGSVSTLTNPVTGTGAQGRVAYWNGAGTITSDSLFQWNDTFNRLGIGKTPSVALDVDGAGFFSSSVTASSLIRSGGTSSQFLMADGSVNTSVLASGAYLPLTLTSTQRIVELNGQFFEVYSSANSFTSGRLIIAPTYGAIGYQTNGIFRGLQILTDGTAFLTNTGTLTMTGALSGTSAVFSSSVTGSGLIAKGTGSFNVNSNIKFIRGTGVEMGYIGWSDESVNNSTWLFKSTNGNPIAFSADAINQQLVILPTGNVGIGTATPLQTSANRTVLTVNGIAGGSAIINIGTDNTVRTYLYGDSGGSTFETIGTNTISASGANIIGFNTNGTERMRITSDGFIFTEAQVQISSGLTSGKLNIGALLNSGQNCITLQSFQSPGGGNFIQFLNNAGGVAGSITHNGTTVVAYNTTSDYRLKEDLQEIKGLEKVQAIKVYDYKWKSEDSRMDGVLAHELAEVLPYAVTGEKDEFNEDGTDKMQSVDYSKIVPILIKAIQELKTEIDSLKNQIK